MTKINFMSVWKFIRDALLIFFGFLLSQLAVIYFTSDALVELEDSTSSVITDGVECYSYRLSQWNVPKCYSSKREASEALTKYIQRLETEKELHSRSWTDVE